MFESAGFFVVVLLEFVLQARFLRYHSNSDVESGKHANLEGISKGLPSALQGRTGPNFAKEPFQASPMFSFPRAEIPMIPL